MKRCLCGKDIKLYPMNDDETSPDWEGWYATDNPNVFMECHETWDNIVYRDEEETDPCYGSVYYSFFEVARWPNGSVGTIRELDGGVMGYEKGDTFKDLQDFIDGSCQHYRILNRVSKKLEEELENCDW